MPKSSALSRPPQKSKPITDFFTRTDPPRTSSPLSSTLSSASLSQSSAQPPVRQASSVSSGNAVASNTTLPDASRSSSGSRSRSFIDPVGLTPLRKFDKGSNVSVSMSSLGKRSRSPENPHVAPSSAKNLTKRASSKSLVRQKTNVAPSANVDSVIYVKRQSRPFVSPHVPRLTSKENLTTMSPLPKLPHKKRPRISPPTSLAKSEAGDLVPSSQSDEHEMAPTRVAKRDPEAVKQSVDQWRKQSLLPSPVMSSLTLTTMLDNVQMDVDTDASSPLPTIDSSPTFAPSEGLSSQLTSPLSSPGPSTPVALRSPTLSSSAGPSTLPPTPVPLDAKSKTARIIADIKARAYEASLSSPEEKPQNTFKDELEESSDEEDLIALKPLNKGFEKRITTSTSGTDPTSVLAVPMSQSGHYHLRDRGRSSPPAVTKLPSPAADISRPKRTAPSRAPVILTSAVNQKEGKHSNKKKSSPSYDPLEALLKEKKLANQRGKGDEAFRLAENALASKEHILEGMDDVAEGNVDWTNEAAARLAMLECERMTMKSTSPESGNLSEEVVLGEDDRERLLGEKHSKAITQILENDREKRKREKEKEKVLGVPLWMEHDITEESLKTSEVASVWRNLGEHSMLHILEAAVDCRDFSQAALLMDSGVMTTINMEAHPQIFSYLISLALSSEESVLNTSAFRALTHIWTQSIHPTPKVSFIVVLSTLVRLGAKLSILNDLGWMTEPEVKAVDAEQRDHVLYRLVMLLTLSARFGRLSNDNASDIVVALLLIAIDPSSTPDLRREIMVAIDNICQSVSQDITVTAKYEVDICTKVLRYMSNLKPINKAYVLSFLTGGTRTTRRIARVTAHSLIAELDMVSVDTYSDLPPLMTLLEHVSSFTGSNTPMSGRGKFEIHDEADYEDMNFYVQILGVAISNIEGYVAEERCIGRPKVFPVSLSRSSSASALEAPVTVLELLRQTIEELHAAIADARGTHLDRSRTKATLKQLSLRMHFQRIAATKGPGDGTGKPRRNIQQYFSKK